MRYMYERGWRAVDYSLFMPLYFCFLPGWVVIQFEVTEEVNFIVFHSLNLRIIEKWVKEEIDGKPSDPHNISKLLEYVPHQQVRPNIFSCNYAWLLKYTHTNKENYICFGPFIANLQGNFAHH